MQAAIFDLDGTVVSDELLYGAAFRKILGDLGIDVRDEYPHKGGIGLDANWRYFIKKYNIKTTRSIKELSQSTQEEFMKNLDKVKIKPGLVDFIEELTSAGIMVSLATSNDWGSADKILNKVGLQKYFSMITTQEEVSAKKPDPELFLVTSQKLGVEPEGCVVFEDSRAGVIAAKAAGMKVVGIARNKDMRRQLSGADLVISNFTESKLRDFLAL